MTQHPALFMHAAIIWETRSNHLSGLHISKPPQPSVCHYFYLPALARKDEPLTRKTQPAAADWCLRPEQLHVTRAPLFFELKWKDFFDFTLFLGVPRGIFSWKDERVLSWSLGNSVFASLDCSTLIALKSHRANPHLPTLVWFNVRCNRKSALFYSLTVFSLGVR